LTHPIEVENLTKRFGEIVAVNHINFIVRKGEILGFLGPNGAGKTTTIRILTGILKPDEGRAFVAGYDVLREPVKVKQCIGVVPEVSNAYVDLSAWDNLMLIGELYGIPKKECVKRATRLLKEYGLYQAKNRLVRGFSKGMKQKLLLCMALINDPEILFLDEPTSGLDVESARLLREKIWQYNSEGRTIFLSTHNMEEANRLCHRIAIINHGEIAAIDTPENLRAQSVELQHVEVAFDKPVKLEEFPKHPEIIKASFAENKVRIYTADPSSIIELIVEFARNRKMRILNLNTVMPSLEDIFIKLVKEHGEKK